MAAIISITESQLFALIRAFFLTIVSCEVVRGQVNRAPMPKGPNFIIFTPGKTVALGRSIETTEGLVLTISQPTEFRIGVDAYGPDAANNARMLSMALRTAYACDQLPGIAPLYADDALQFPLTSGEEQYIERWRFDCVLQYTPSLSLPTSSALALNLGVVSVDATYPP